MTDAGSGGTVNVSWPRNRASVRSALRVLPAYRLLRAGTWWIVAVSAAILAMAAVADGLSAREMARAVVRGALAIGAYWFCQEGALVAAGTGIASWRVDGSGLRVDNELVVEIPWSKVLGWRRVTGHLVVEFLPTARRSSSMAIAAPLSAFSPDDWRRTEALLRRHSGRPRAS